MRSLTLFSLAGALLLGSASCMRLRLGAQPAIPGTYEPRACTEPCDPRTSPSEAMGTLVLAESRFSLDRLPAGVRRHLSEFDPWLLVALEDEEPNGCFLLSRSPGAPSSVLGLSPVGVTEWRAENDTITVRLWVSPDAGYVGHFELKDAELVGRGYTWAEGMRYGPTRELIVATRRGPPVLDRCFETIGSDAAPR